jgi:hypothetical protein
MSTATSRPTPTGVVLLRVLGAALVVAALLAVSVRVATGFARAEERTVVDGGSTQVLELDLPAGDVRLERGTGDLAVTVDRRGTWRLPGLEEERRGDALALTGTCSPGPGECRYDVVVSAPADLRIVVRLGAGAVRGGTGLGGPMDVELGAGQVDLDGLLSPRVRARTGAGEVVLDFAAAPRLVDAVTGVGRVEVLVPDDGSRYDVDALAEVGGSVVAVPTASDAGRTVIARSEVGHVRVGLAAAAQ